MPNPTTVFDAEYDERKEDQDGPEVYSSLPDEGGLADGLPGGRHDDCVQFDLDKGAKTLDDASHAGQLEHIARLEADCQRYESIWKQLKADCKSAFADFDAACSRLRAYIRGLAIPMPLFERASNDSPAGENDTSSGDGVLPSGDSDSSCGMDHGSCVGVNKSSETDAGGCVKGRGGDDQALDDQEKPRGSPSDTEPDEGWERVDLSRIFSPGIAKKFAAAGILSLGQLTEFRSDGKDYSEIKGIGPSKEVEIENSLECFWADWENRK